MTALARLVIARRWWVVAVWVLLAALGGFAAPRAVDRLSFDFGLPGQPGYETNVDILKTLGSGGNNAPVLLVVGDGSAAVAKDSAAPIAAAVGKALKGPGSRPMRTAQTCCRATGIDL